MKLHQSEQGNKDEEGADEGWPGHSMAFERILSGKKKDCMRFPIFVPDLKRQ